jgi:hypothetical protein
VIPRKNNIFALTSANLIQHCTGWSGQDDDRISMLASATLGRLRVWGCRIEAMIYIVLSASLEHPAGGASLQRQGGHL